MILILDQIIDEAYKIFQNYKLGANLDVCPCCVSKEEEAQLLRTPLNSISREIMNFYYDSARRFTDKELIEMKHFLPRVLELISNFEFPCHSIEIVFSRLDFEKNEMWMKEERDLLNDFAVVYFEKYISIYPLPHCSIDSILVMFGNAHFDLSKVFELWLRFEKLSGILHLVDLFEYVITDYDGKSLIGFKNSFAERQMIQKISDWLNSPETKIHFSKRIERIILNNEIQDEKITIILSWIHDVMTAR